MRPFLAMAAVSLVACGTGPGEIPEDTIPCATQSECDPNRKKVCEDGYCSALLPDNSTLNDNKESIYLRGLNVAVHKIRFQVPKAIRAYVIYPITPAGKSVVCADIDSHEELNDPTQYNLTMAPLETQITDPGDVIKTNVFVNGPGRVLYVEIYNRPFHDGPERIGRGCLEAGEVPVSGTIGMTLDPVAG